MTTPKQSRFTADQAVTRFFGSLDHWPLESDGINFTQDQIRAIAEHIALTGDCLWHAQSIVLGWKACHCANCVRN